MFFLRSSKYKSTVTLWEVTLSVSVNNSKYVYLLTGQVVELFVSAEAVSVPYNLQTSKMILQVYHLGTVKSKNYKSKLINQLITIFLKNVIELEHSSCLIEKTSL